VVYASRPFSCSGTYAVVTSFGGGVLPPRAAHTCCGGAFGMNRITDSRSPFSLRYDGTQSFGTVPQQGVRTCGEFSPQSAAMHTPAAFFLRRKHATTPGKRSSLVCAAMLSVGTHLLFLCRE